MKVLFTSDLHLGLNNFGKINPETGIHSTVEKFVDELNNTLDGMIKRKEEVWILPGDITHVRTPTNFVRQAFTSIVERARKEGIQIYCMLGNHDQLITHGAKNNLTELAVMNIPGFKIIEKSCIKKIKNEKEEVLQVLFLPWQKEVKDIIEDAKRLIEKLDEEYPAIIVGHFSVSGAEVGSEKIFELYGEATVPVKELMSSKVQATFLGHIHKRQVFEKGKVRYIGSMDRIDFSERDESKGSTLLDIDLNTKEYHISFIEGTPREFKQFEVDDLDELNKINFKDCKGVVVKVKIKCTQEQKRGFNLERLYEQLSDTAYLIVQFEVERKEQKSIIKEMTQELSISEALNLWLRDQELDDEIKKLVKKEAVKLIEEEKI